MRPDVLPASLSRQENGLWVPETLSKISYPEGGLSHFVDVEQRSFWFRHRNRCIVAAISHYPPQGVIVDVGAGTGFVASGIRDAGFEVVAVEPHVDGALIALRRGLEHVVCGSFDDIGFAPSSVAAIGLFDVLEHIEDDIGTLARFRDVLKPDGRLYITVPSYNFLFSSEDLAVSHFRRYTAVSCSRALERAGFITEYHSYLFLFLLVPILVLRAIPYRLGIRQSATVESVAAAHNIAGITATAVNGFLDFEARRIARGARLAFGSSCLLVARKAP
jgi:SAM-dependent methyltransferase